MLNSGEGVKVDPLHATESTLFDMDLCISVGLADRVTSSSRPMAVDREFVYIGFGPDGPPLAPHGAATGSHGVAMGTTWASHGIQWGPKAKNIDFPVVFQWLEPETLIFFWLFKG